MVEVLSSDVYSPRRIVDLLVGPSFSHPTTARSQPVEVKSLRGASIYQGVLPFVRYEFSSTTVLALFFSEYQINGFP